MSKFRRLRPTPALVISCVALFVALGGVGYAAATINGSSIKNGTITPNKIKKRSLSGSQIRPNGIGGPSIKESTLGEVPKAKTAQTATDATNATNATTAKNAAELGGVPASGYVRQGQSAPANSTQHGVFNCTSTSPTTTYCREEVTLQYPAPQGLVNATVNFAPLTTATFTAGDADPTCTGNPNTPTAPPGKVCLYVASSNSTELVTGQGNAVGNALGTLGFEVELTQAGTGAVDLVGVWAYTAP